ncbi:MAG: hypothetical protein HC825_02510 [Oscillatoriales cyanobacterium RM1_1_9]|nr:hypothetical protein [Oscillatoriales cyanobacterium RM1_1_9]
MTHPSAVAGLLVGLPAFIAFNYFTSTVNRFVLDVEESAAELIEAVTFQLALAGNEDRYFDVRRFLFEKKGQTGGAIRRSVPWPPCGLS